LTLLTSTVQSRDIRKSAIINNQGKAMSFPVVQFEPEDDVINEIGEPDLTDVDKLANMTHY